MGYTCTLADIDRPSSRCASSRRCLLLIQYSYITERYTPDTEATLPEMRASEVAESWRGRIDKRFDLVRDND